MLIVNIGWIIVLEVILISCRVEGDGAVEFLDEELWIRPIPERNRVVGHFEFKLQSRKSLQHYRLLPKLIGELVRKYHIREMQLTFTVGKWSVVNWGVPRVTGPFGAEIWATFDPTKDGDALWKGLTSELAGGFCASLNLVDEIRTFFPLAEKIRPPWLLQNKPGEDLFSRRPLGNGKGLNNTVYHGTLPREALCTENLTPWLKLLTCRSKQGLGVLINPLRVLDSDYNSIGIYIRHTPCDRENCKVSTDVLQTLTAVFRPKSPTWSLQSLLARTGASPLLSRCPLARRSAIYTETEGPGVFSVRPTRTMEHPPSPWTIGVETSSTVAIHELGMEPLSIADQWVKAPRRAARTAVATVHRHLFGKGQAKGGLAVKMKNSHPSCSVVVSYVDNIPWFLRIYFSTMQIVLNGKLVDPFEHSSFRLMDVVPAEEHGHPSLIEMAVELPPNGEMILSVQFEKAFLALTEHPPDANRGADIAPSISTWYYTNKCAMEDVQPLRVYSASLLVPLPTPDFSMPYNVITLTSTLLAFFLGSILNQLLLRKKPNRLDRAKKEKDTLEGKNLIGKIRNFFKGKKPSAKTE